MDTQERPVVLAVGRAAPLRDGSLLVRTAETPETVLEALAERRPSAVVVEHDPPALDGLAVVETVRDRYGGVPVLLWTDDPDGEVAAAATRAGVTEYAHAGGDPSLADRVRAVATEAARTPFVEEPARVLERIDDGFVAIDDEWQFTFANRRTEELLGIPPSDLVGRDAREALPDSVRESFERAMAEQSPVTFERWFEPVERWLLVSVYPDEDGLSVYVRDTTAERRYREALSTLLETASELMVAETEAAVAEIAVDAAADIVGFELNGVRRFDHATGKLELVRETEAAERRLSAPRALAPNEHLQGKAYVAGETIVVDDPTGDGDGQYEGVRAAATVPLGTYGTLTVGTTEEGGIDSVDRDLLELLGLSVESAMARAEREESLREYRAVHETVDQMVYTLDETGHISLITEPMAERFGFDREELVGEHIRALIPETDVARGEELIDELLEEPPGASRTYETTVHPREGESFPIEVDITLFRRGGEFRGSVGVVRDVSALHRARAELADERDRFAYLFEQSPDAVAEVRVVDGDPVIEAVNPAFETVFGHDAETVRGESLNELVVPAGEDEGASAIDQRAIGGEVVREEVRRETAEGTREFLCTGVPYDLESEQPRGFAIYTDITEQRDRERRLQVLYRVLRHNLRNDMNVITGNAADIRSALAERDPELAALAAAIYDRAIQVADISRKAGDVQRAMDTESVRYGVELDRVVEQAVGQVERGHEDADVRTAVPGITVLTTGGLERAVENVVENGVVHTDADHPTVEVGVDRSAPEGYVDLRVADEGPGIPAREKSVLAEDGEITQLRHSRGLGLWTARWVVEASGGELRFEENEAGGAVVVLRLRLAGPDAE